MSDRPKNFSAQRVQSSKSFNGRKAITDLYKSTKWQNYRSKFLGHNKLCYGCGKYASVADHLVPHQGDEHLFWKTDNIIPLCEKCHNTITALFDRFYKKGNSINDKLEWLQWSRAKNNLLRTKVIVVPLDPD